MPIGVLNLQWLNHNSQRSYPLTDWATKQDITGTITIPDSFLLSAYLPVHSGLNVQPEKFFIDGLGIFPTGYSLSIAYYTGSGNPRPVANCNVARASHTENRSYELAGTGDFADSFGRITIGRLDDIDRLPPGYYQFAYTATGLETDVIRPMLRGISSLTVVNGSDRSERLYGDIELVAGSNMRIVVNQIEGQPPQVIFSAISGEGLTAACDCADTQDLPAMRFINGIPPLPDGNFRIVGNKCLEIAPILNGLRFSDTCSQPCCGCAELEAITAQIHRFADGAATLEAFAANLGGEVSQMTQVVLGSRLSDTGCITCDG